MQNDTYLPFSSSVCCSWPPLDADWMCLECVSALISLPSACPTLNLQSRRRRLLRESGGGAGVGGGGMQLFF